MSAPALNETQTMLVAPISRGALFSGFLKIGLMGFGGVASAARYVIVEDRKWLDEREYAAMTGVGQVLPGANTVNVAVMLGDKNQGITGAIAAVIGLMVMPVLILVAVATLYQAFADLPDVKSGIAGAAAAAAGVVMGTAIKMARNIKPGLMAILFGLAAFVAAGLLRIPLFWTVLTLAPLSIGALVLLEKRK